MTGFLRRILLWLCTLLAAGVAVLAVRSFWRGDEIGYYTWKPVPGQAGRDCRQIVGSWRGGLFWLSTTQDLDTARVDWYGGEPTEVIVRRSANSQLAVAALETASAAAPRAVAPVPRWMLGGFKLKADSAQAPTSAARSGLATAPPGPGFSAGKWWYRLVVVPHWALFLLLAWPAAVAARGRWVLRQRRKCGLCLTCGYDLRASGEICSECGQRRAPPAITKVSPRLALRRRWVAAVACAVRVAGAALSMGYRRVQRPEPAVRLDRDTPLVAGRLPRRVELDLGRGITMRLALIPEGRFLMGSPPDERDRSGDETQHEVRIGTFYMGQTTVTQEQYEAVMGNNPSSFKGPGNPVETVSWDEAAEFCKKLSSKTGRNVRLPTEAQWEYACRAGATTPFNTGPTLPGDRANYGVRWTYPSNRIGQPDWAPVRVGSFKPNAWGLHDMHGNIWQWCADWYADKYPSGPLTDPTGPASGAARVLRGGSWLNDPLNCRSAYRISHGPDDRNYIIGFRVALDFR